MRIVLDTNVLISGIFFSGPPHQILKAWQQGKLTLVISESIFDEYQRVASKLSSQFPDVELEFILALILAENELIHAVDLQERVCDDTDDDKFLACALAGKCKIVISGDKALLKVSGYRGINVMKPREFVENFL